MLMWVLFASLLAEFAILALLIVPYAPSIVVRTVLNALARARWYSQRFALVVLLSFAWQTHKMLDAQRLAKESKSTIHDVKLGSVHHAMEQKFRTERNFYLMLFILSLYIIILRLEFVMKDRLETQAKVKSLRIELDLARGATSGTRESTADKKKD